MSTYGSFEIGLVRARVSEEDPIGTFSLNLADVETSTGNFFFSQGLGT